MSGSNGHPGGNGQGEHHFTTHFVESGGVDMAVTETALTEAHREEMRQIAARYPQARSALLPMLHLVQSVEGRVTPAGIEACADVLQLSAAEVSGVATFYTMYKRKPVGRHHVGVCTTALCAILGGDEVLAALQRHLGVGNDETTEGGAITLEHIECNAACDYAPVMMVNWEFFDDVTPDSAVAVVDALRAGEPVSSTRGAEITSWREAERVLAGFPDGRADSGPTAGAASLLGLRIARERGWQAPPVGGQAERPAQTQDDAGAQTQRAEPVEAPATQSPEALRQAQGAGAGSGAGAGAGSGAGSVAGSGAGAGAGSGAGAGAGSGAGDGVGSEGKAGVAEVNAEATTGPAEPDATRREAAEESTEDARSADGEGRDQTSDGGGKR